MKKEIVSVLMSAYILVGCGGDIGSDDNTTGVVTLTKEELGERLFFDVNLSLTRKTSCSTCHNPEHGFVDNRFTKEGADQSVFVHGALSVGDDGSALGGRNAPTAAYAKFSPDFDAKRVRGGQFHDGRADSLKEQSKRPPLDPTEMMMSDAASVVARIQENPLYVASFKALFRESIFDDTDAAYDAMGEVISKFEKTELFSPFDSKYDRYVACKEAGGRTSECLAQGAWTGDEQLGMDLFFSDANTNCKTCHMLQTQSEVFGETFTNYEYHNIGTPQNKETVEARFQLGLGEQNATEHGVFGAYPNEVNASKDAALKVPTLRNVAITAPYMHNGVFKDLKTVLAFYDHRGSGDRPLNPETQEAWSEPDVNATINRRDLAMPALNDRKIEALEAFLKTLTDKRYESLIQ